MAVCNWWMSCKTATLSLRNVLCTPKLHSIGGDSGGGGGGTKPAPLQHQHKHQHQVPGKWCHQVASGQRVSC